MNQITKATLAVLFMFLMVVGCEDAPPLTTDPLEIEIPFTFSPAHASPGDQVMIEGTGFNEVSKVSIGVIEAEVLSKTDTKITVKVPVAAISGKIKLVVNGKVITSATEFIVDATPVPTIMEFSPALAGSGETITVNGNLLDRIDSVYVGNLKATMLAGQTATQLKFTTPAGLKTAKIRLFYDYVTSYGITKVAEVQSATDLSLKLPTLESFAPEISSLNIGDVITVTGTMLNVVTDVKFGTVAAVFTIVSETEMTVTVPAGATTGKIVFTVPDGTVSSGTFVVNLPAIASFSPDKGAETVGITRAIVILGTKLDLVNNVLVGATTATIQTKTAGMLIITVPGNVAGFIKLEAPNGNVTSTVPFFFTGDMWVNDWSSVFPIDRYDRIANNGLGGYALDETAGYAQVSANGDINGKSFYLWGPAAGNDKFSLYTPNPDGVYLEFDLNIASLPDSLKQPDGTMKFKIFMMDALGWGASGEYSYGYNGPTSYVRTDGEWQHFKMHLKDFKASNNSGLYTADQVTPTAGAFCHPNSLRIITYVFGTANASGKGSMTVRLDNVKFLIN